MSELIEVGPLVKVYPDGTRAYNPVTYVINTARDFMNFGYAWKEFAKAMGVIALVGVFTLTGATQAFKKATS